MHLLTKSKTKTRSMKMLASNKIKIKATDPCEASSNTPHRELYLLNNIYVQMVQ